MLALWKIWTFQERKKKTIGKGKCSGFKPILVEVGGHTSTDSCNGPNTVVWKGGLYIKTKASDMQLNCLVDTGANRSIIHSAMYFGIPDFFNILLTQENIHI